MERFFFFLLEEKGSRLVDLRAASMPEPEICEQYRMQGLLWRDIKVSRYQGSIKRRWNDVSVLGRAYSFLSWYSICGVRFLFLFFIPCKKLVSAPWYQGKKERKNIYHLQDAKRVKHPNWFVSFERTKKKKKKEKFTHPPLTRTALTEHIGTPVLFSFLQYLVYIYTCNVVPRQLQCFGSGYAMSHLLLCQKSSGLT